MMLDAIIALLKILGFYTRLNPSKRPGALLTTNSQQLAGCICGKQKRGECKFLMLTLSFIFTLSGSFSSFMKYF